MKFEVEFYEKENGNQPVREFIISQEKKMIAKILDMINLLQDNGYQLREPYSKALEDGLFELRIKSGSNISRIIYFFYVNRRIILTNGFVKKTQKIPRIEIDKAIRYRDDYLSRSGDSNEYKI